jgi:hypothetical protein
MVKELEIIVHDTMSPTQITEAIASHIKSKMKYDAMTAILTTFPKLDINT